MKAYMVGLGVVIALLGGFYGGYKVGVAKAPTSTPAASTNTPRTNGGGGGGAGGFGGGGGGRFGGGGGAGGFGGTIGVITAVGNGTITVHNPNTGTDITVTLGSNVQIRKTETGSTSDLQSQAIVQITGARQADGSVQATAITILPPGTTIPTPRPRPSGTPVAQ